MSAMFSGSAYTIRRKILKIVGGAFHIWNEAGTLVAYSEQKAFKLKEDIKVFADETKSRELLAIKARAIIDWSAAYDVTDSTSGEPVGALRRRGAKSILRDEWHVLDAQDNTIGVIIEDSMALALIRRLLTNLVPQRYDAYVPDATSGVKVASMDQAFNPFVYRMKVEFMPQGQASLDPRLGIAASILLAAVEGRQS